MQLSNCGGVVKPVTAGYFDDQKPPRLPDLLLIRTQRTGYLSVSFTDVLNQLQKQTQRFNRTDARGDEENVPSHTKFHWSDGHLDVTKKLTFDQGYEATAEVLVALDGKPLPAAVAWRGGFGDRAVYKASQLVTVFYKVDGKLNLLQYKKLGVPNNQSRAVRRAGWPNAIRMWRQRRSILHRQHSFHDSSDLVLVTGRRSRNVNGSSEPVAEMAVGIGRSRPLAVQMRAFVGPKDLAMLSNGKSRRSRS